MLNWTPSVLSGTGLIRKPSFQEQSESLPHGHEAYPDWEPKPLGFRPDSVTVSTWATHLSFGLHSFFSCESKIWV